MNWALDAKDVIATDFARSYPVAMTILRVKLHSPQSLTLNSEIQNNPNTTRFFKD